VSNLHLFYLLGKMTKPKALQAIEKYVGVEQKQFDGEYDEGSAQTH